MTSHIYHNNPRSSLHETFHVICKVKYGCFTNDETYVLIFEDSCKLTINWFKSLFLHLLFLCEEISYQTQPTYPHQQ
jgi:hypothetical protein